MKKLSIAIMALMIATPLFAAKRPQWNKTTATSTYQVFAGTIALSASNGLDVWRSSATFAQTITLSGDSGNVTAQGLNVTSATIGTLTVTNNFNFVPTGTILPYVSTSVIPTGYLYCNGQSVSTTTFSALFAVIGYSFGGSTSTMMVPDMRGMFMRGIDNGRGYDTDTSRVIGSTQTDTMQGHYHDAYVYNAGTGGVPFQYSENTGSRLMSGVSGGYGVVWPITDGTNGTPRTSNETRPENIAVAYIIKH